MKNPNHQKRENPLGPNIPIDPTTQYNKDYVKYPSDILEPFEMIEPEHNLQCTNEPFLNKYKPISTDLGRQTRKIDCPMRK